MPMNVLYESPVGFALFQVLDEGRLAEVSDVQTLFEDPGSLSGVLQLKKFKKFVDQIEATGAAVSLTEGKIAKPLKKMLKKLVSDDVQNSLAVADTKLGAMIREEIGLECIHSPVIHELMRGIRQHLTELTGIEESERSAMALGLAHSLSRYKLKFSPDKVDTMIVQAISLLDDLDKELNNYVMRVREWYGWHFPEMGKVVTDNLAYSKTIRKMSFRINCATTDFSDILPEDIEETLKEVAEVSMGTDISEDDMLNILALADQVIEITEYRAQLFEYLKNRMAAIAPNLTVLVGELVGARLIAHAGSLLNLAKHPASTVQILGAEKALFRALKTKQDTPKYGLIYHASMVGQAAPKHKGKISRMLAAKAALAIRYDALAEGDDEGTANFAIEARTSLEKRLRELETRKTKIGGGKRTPGDKYRHKSEVVSYDPSQDNTNRKRKSVGESPDEKPPKVPKTEPKEEPADLDGSINLPVKSEPDSTESPKKVKKDKKKKKKKDKKREEEAEEAEE